MVSGRDQETSGLTNSQISSSVSSLTTFYLHRNHPPRCLWHFQKGILLNLKETGRWMAVWASPLQMKKMGAQEGQLYVWQAGSVQFSHSVMSNSLRPHGLQHARPPHPSPTPGVCSNSCPLSWWCHPAISPSVVPFSSFNLSQIRVFSNESVLRIRWPKYWSFSFSISPSNEYSGLISFRMDWLDLLAVQGTLKSLLQHYSSKASILWCSVFFTVKLSHPYMTTGKTIALTRWTFVGKVMSLLLICCLGWS